MGDRYLSLHGLAQYAGLSERTLRRHLSAPTRSLPHYRVGGRVLVRQSEFEAWMAAHRRACSDAERLARQILGEPA